VATISSLLSEHVSLRVRSVDRIFLAGYVPRPRLQCDGQLVRFLNERAGGTIPTFCFGAGSCSSNCQLYSVRCSGSQWRRSRWRNSAHSPVCNRGFRGFVRLS
jgi:hypothetical protein